MALQFIFLREVSDKKIIWTSTAYILNKTDPKPTTKDPQLLSIDYISPVPWGYEKTSKKDLDLMPNFFFLITEMVFYNDPVTEQTPHTHSFQ